MKRCVKNEAGRCHSLMNKMITIKLSVACVILLLFSQGCTTIKTPTLDESKSDNSQQLSQPENNPPDADAPISRAEKYTALRLEYAASKAYNPYKSGLVETIKKSETLIEEGKFSEALDEAEKGLLFDSLNIRLLVIKAAAYRKLGEIEKAEKTRQQWVGLVESLFASGDGKSFETAFHVISVDEEYALLMILKLTPTRQSLIEHSGSQYDMLEVRSQATGVESEIYFNIDIPKSWLDENMLRMKDSTPNEAEAE